MRTSPNEAPMRAGSDRTMALAIFFLALVVFNANFRVVNAGGDAVGSRYIALYLWRTASLTLDGAAELATRVPPGKPYTRPYWTWRSRDGHLLSITPIVTPLLAAPFAAPAALLLGSEGWDDETRVARLALVSEKLAASFFCALAAGLFFLLVRRRLEVGRATLLTFAFAFGTGTWPIGSQSLWQHGTAELLLVAALLGATGRATPGNLAWTGLVCGWMVGNRPPDTILVGAVFLHLLLSCGFRLWPAIVAGAAALLPVVVYNVHYFDRLAGGYARLGLAGSHPFFNHPVFEGMAGLLISPGKGLLLFSPFFLFLAAAPRAWTKEPHRRLACFLAAAVGLQLFFYARTDWRSGDCYGPRYLTDALPALCWLLVPVVARMRGLGHGLFVVALVVAIAIQAVGAFCYPHGGSDERFYPRERDRNEIGPEVWEPRNAAFLVEARGGLAPIGFEP